MKVYDFGMFGVMVGLWSSQGSMEESLGSRSGRGGHWFLGEVLGGWRNMGLVILGRGN